MIPQRDLSQVLAQEGASNLFYYLFEDYAAAGPFQAARDTLRELVCHTPSMPEFKLANCYQTPIVLQSDASIIDIPVPNFKLTFFRAAK